MTSHDSDSPPHARGIAAADAEPRPPVTITRRRALQVLGATGLAAAGSSLLPASRALAAVGATAGAGPSPSWWGRPGARLTTTATLQLVANPRIERSSSIHDAVFSELAELGCDHVRYVPWYPYPRLGVAELTAPTQTSTSWDFSEIDPIVEDFEAATRGHTTILNFSTTPEWMWESGWSVADGRLTVVGNDNGSAAGGAAWSDYTVSVQVTPLDTGTQGALTYAQAGCLFRMDPTGQNGYAFLLSNYPYTSPAASGYVVFLKLEGGAAVEITPTALPFSIDPGTTYEVAITASGDALSIGVDGTRVDAVTDPTYPRGTIGFREDGTESARFADVVVTAPSGRVLLEDDFSDGLGKWTPVPLTGADTPDWNYSTGSTLAVPVQTVADYYRRLVSWYVDGGFVDELGQRHVSGHHYALPFWEVLNEMEHNLSPALYTRLYDAIVSAIRSVSPETEFVGLALSQGDDATEYVSYFLDPANHQPGIPLDWISYHFYASVDPGSAADWGPTGFSQADGFLSTVDEIEAIRTRLAPHVRTTIDEVGTFLSSATTQADPSPVPSAYWNFSGAVYAYLFGHLALKGIDVVGESQLVGYPSQYPSVSMVDWSNGRPNARYRVLQLLHGELGPGLDLVPDALGAGTDEYFALGFQRDAEHKLLLVNKTDAPITVALPGLRRARLKVVDQSSAGGPIAQRAVRDQRVSLGGYAVGIVSFG